MAKMQVDQQSCLLPPCKTELAFLRDSPEAVITGRPLRRMSVNAHVPDFRRHVNATGN